MQAVHVPLQPNPRSQLRLQLGRRGRQLDHVPKAILQRRQPRVVRRAGIADADNRDRRLASHAPELPADVDSRADGQPQIKQHRIRAPVREESGQRLRSPSCNQPKPILAQETGQRSQQRVIGGEDGHIGRLGLLDRGRARRAPLSQPGYNHRSPHLWGTFGRPTPILTARGEPWVHASEPDPLTSYKTTC